jgi:hypothetical protein
MKKLLPLTLTALFFFSSCKPQPTDIDITSTPPVNDITVSEVAAESTTAPETTLSKSETETITIISQTEAGETEQSTTVLSESANSETKTETETSLTETTTVSETEIIETEVEEIMPIEGLPDVVFIKITLPEWEHKLDQKVFWSYIDNKGLVKSFEVEMKFEAHPHVNNINDQNYCINLIKERYNSLEEISTDTGLRVEKSDLTNYYNKLLNLEKGCERKYSNEGYEDVYTGFDNIYGIKKGGGDEIEVIVLQDDSDDFYSVKSDDVKELAKEVYSCFPEIIDPRL